MASEAFSFDHESYGRLDVHPTTSGFVDIYYIPPDNFAIQDNQNNIDKFQNKVKLLQLDSNKQSLTMFPFKRTMESEISPKYSIIRSITLEGILEVPHPDNEIETDFIDNYLLGLPDCFVTHYYFGLGFKKSYRFIVHAVEELSSCRKIIISKFTETKIDEGNSSFYISYDDFEILRKNINNAIQMNNVAVRTVNNVKTYNSLAEKIGKQKKQVTIGRNPLRKIFTTIADGGEVPLSHDDQEKLLHSVSYYAKSIASAKPDRLLKLRSDIELATLDELISQFDEMLTNKISENKWQEFLSNYPIILSMAFGVPIIKVLEQASVGGRKLSGKGENITDFLVKNSLTHNSALVEIKTPRTKLLNKTPYRSEVFIASAELSGSIGQLLNQKYHYEQEIVQKLQNSNIQNVKSYSVRCCLIIGVLPSDEEQQKSFEFIRGNSKEVDIVTYDELLEKLKQTREMLS